MIEYSFTIYWWGWLRNSPDKGLQNGPLKTWKPVWRERIIRIIRIIRMTRMTRITLINQQTTTHGLNYVSHYWRVLLDWKLFSGWIYSCIMEYLTFAVCYSLWIIWDCVWHLNMISKVLQIWYMHAPSHYRNGDWIFNVGACLSCLDMVDREWKLLYTDPLNYKKQCITIVWNRCCIVNETLE